MWNLLRCPPVLILVAAYLYFAGSASFLGQWDTFDYLKQIVTHRLSDLGFGRPVYIGYNILLWEGARSVFDLEPVKVEAVAMLATVLFGVAGVVLFHRLALNYFSPAAARMAALAFAVSPLYAVYAGFIMTEVPMLGVLLASAVVLGGPSARSSVWRDAAGGILFGAAVGIREQAITLGAAYLWILLNRRQAGRLRFRSAVVFGVAALLALVAPLAAIYLADPASSLSRVETWLRIIPLGGSQFWNNVQASALFSFAASPASWLAAAMAAVYALSKKQTAAGPGLEPARIPHGALGFLCSVVLPVAVLWRDADVQMHPRYLLLILPGSVIFCTYVFSRLRSSKGPVIWAVIHVAVFGVSLALLQPMRQMHAEKMEFARSVRDAVPGPGLLIAGSYSPMLDYYRGIGVRPEWQILWSGWEWRSEAATRLVHKAWEEELPVYFSTQPLGWRYFETEHLHFHDLFAACRQEAVLPHLYRVRPNGGIPGPAR